jgi:DNA mismatch repair protein MutS
MTDKPNIITEYINITHEYILKYGENTILLMQVGAFFEMYGTKMEASLIYKGSRIEDICRICELNISDKKIQVQNENVYMAGFRDYSLDKYLQRIMDAGYTAVVYVQKKDSEGKVSRELYNVVSPGTYINYETEISQQVSNNIMCVWMNVTRDFITKKENLIYGVSIIDIYTGKTFMFEYKCPYILNNPTTFDELDRCFSVFSPNELILITPFDDAINDNLLKLVGSTARVVHTFNFNKTDNPTIANCEKQKYITEIISDFFGEDSYNTCKEFNDNALATQSFCFLLNFVREHCANLVKRIDIPLFSNTSSRTILANHTLKQLNIINDNVNGNYGKISSVSSFLNCTNCPMGKRLMNYQFVNPCFDETWLKSEYDIIEYTTHKTELIENLRRKLTSVRDIDKILRQLVSRRLYPNSVYHLYSSISLIKDVNVLLLDEPGIIDYALKTGGCYDTVHNNVINLLDFIDSKVVVEFCKGCTSINTFANNIIKEGVSHTLDDAIHKRNRDNDTFNAIKDELNKRMRISEHDTSGLIEYVKCHETDKSGISLVITKKRGEKLLNLCKGADDIINVCGSEFKLSDIKMLSTTSTNSTIHFNLLKLVTSELYSINGKIDKLIEIEYNRFLTELENCWHDQIDYLSEFISRIDVLQSKAHVANKYNYCKPSIRSDCDKSFAQVRDIRHPLIEHLQTNELYVANDISIGIDGVNGTLIYGTNAVGKTSIIRALGIAVLLAQSGMFVPCSSFIFKPYKAVYSRILGNDNLFKGLSTFAVEMSELRIIDKMADEYSLVLGDELCSGTETESALSLFTAALMRLSRKKVSYVFATHFHEILKFEEIAEMPELRIAHMAVSYDAEKDALVYDRKLKDGPGNRMYGLEVCKSLYLDPEFLDQAYALRKKYFPVNKGLLDRYTSSYNANKIKGMCEHCHKEQAVDTHHLLHQENADKKGWIDTTHKNHKANLMSLCKKCHDLMHSGDNVQLMRKKTTGGYILQATNT